MTGEPNIDQKAIRMATLPEEAANRLKTVPQVNQEQVDRQILADKIRKDVENSPKPAESLLISTRNVDVPSSQVASSRIEGHILRSGNLNANGTIDRDQGEDQRFKRETNADRIVRHVIEVGGINALINTDIRSLEASMRDYFVEISDTALSPDQQINIVDALVQDEDLLKIIKRRYAEIIAEGVPDEVTSAAEAKKQAESSKDEADRRNTEANTEKARLKGREHALDKNNPDPDSDYHKLEKLNAIDLARDQADGERIVKRASKRYNEKLDEYGPNPTDQAQANELTLLKSERDGADSSLAGIKKDIIDKSTLQTEVSELPGKLRDIDRTIEDATQAVQRTKDEVGRTDSALSLARADRRDKEEIIVKRLENLIYDSTVELTNIRITKVNEVARERLTREAETATNEVGKIMAEEVSNRYFRKVEVFSPGSKGRTRFWRRTSQASSTKVGEDIGVDGVKAIKVGEDIGVDGEKAIKDIKSILKLDGGGTPELVKQVLTEMYTSKDSNGIDVVDQSSVDHYMNDPAFVEKWGLELGRQTINAYIQTGGIITEMQGEYIEAQSWGTGLIQKAVETPEVAVAEKALKESSQLPPGGFKEFLKTKKGKTCIALILGLAAGVILPAAASAMMASKIEY